MLDSLAPVESVHCPGPTPDRHLSQAALNARHERRCLNRWWKRSGKESDRVVYRESSRRTIELINRSHLNRKKIEDCEEDPKKKWRVVKKLLHLPRSPKTSGWQIHSQNYFQNKVMKIRSAIHQKLGATMADPIRADRQHNGR